MVVPAVAATPLGFFSVVVLFVFLFLFGLILCFIFGVILCSFGLFFVFFVCCFNFCLLFLPVCCLLALLVFLGFFWFYYGLFAWCFFPRYFVVLFLLFCFCFGIVWLGRPWFLLPARAYPRFRPKA